MIQNLSISELNEQETESVSGGIGCIGTTALAFGTFLLGILTEGAYRGIKITKTITDLPEFRTCVSRKSGGEMAEMSTNRLFISTTYEIYFGKDNNDNVLIKCFGEAGKKLFHSD